MNPIGGEIAIKNNNELNYLTDSGRSSLRLFIRSNNLKSKKFLVPSFLCGIIEEVLQQEEITYSFYEVNEDLSVDFESFTESDFDVFYSINYFGIIQNLGKLNLEEKILIEDNVFLFDFDNINNAKHWFAFNSYRKISPLTDGSLIKTNLKINDSLISNLSAPFAELKKKACEVKHDYLTQKKYSESEYLNYFEKGEEEIDEQKKVFNPSPYSLNLLFSNKIENQEVAEKRFYELQELTGSKLQTPLCFSFFPFYVKNKLELLKSMRDKNIFLPNFWPSSSKNNILYANLVAIPLFHNYTDIEFNYMVDELRKFLENGK